MFATAMGMVLTASVPRYAATAKESYPTAMALGIINSRFRTPISSDIRRTSQTA
jgi:hypothetical protein